MEHATASLGPKSTAAQLDHVFGATLAESAGALHRQRAQLFDRSLAKGRRAPQLTLLGQDSGLRLRRNRGVDAAV